MSETEEPNTEEFCDQCAGPHADEWLKIYSGHWDTCPNGRSSTAPEHSYEAIRTDVISALASDGFAYLEAEALVKIFERHVVLRASGGES